MAQIQHILIEQGATFSIELTVKDASGSAMDLTAYSARCFLRKSPASKTAYPLTALVLSPPTEGNVKLSASPSNSREIPAGRYLYTVEVFSAADADVIRVIEGLVTISATTYVPA